MGFGTHSGVCRFPLASQEKQARYGYATQRLELLRFTNLECSYGAREIFAGVSGVLNQGDRVGLVGPNGAGKSSLLRLLSGAEQPGSGSVVRARDAKLAYLAQSVSDETDATLQELIDAALLRAGHEEFGLRKKMLRSMLAGFGFSVESFAVRCVSFPAVNAQKRRWRTCSSTIPTT